MASLLSNPRRIAFGAAIVVALATQFAAQGGPADKATTAVSGALRKDAPEAAASAAAVVRARPAPTAWFALGADEESQPSRSLQAPAQSWAVVQPAPGAEEIRRPPPRGVDFPENN